MMIPRACLLIVLLAPAFRVHAFQREIDRATAKRGEASLDMQQHLSDLREHHDAMIRRATGKTLQDWQYEKMKQRKIRDAGRRIAKLDRRLSRLHQDLDRLLKSLGWKLPGD